MQGVIMAAGLGSRFGIYTEDRPKAFIEVGGITMIERSIDTLIDCGIRSILIGTGYRHEVFEQLAQRYMHDHPAIEITCCHSPRYAETNSMYTLYNMRHLLQDNYLLLESDLVYERGAIEALLSDPHPDIMLTTPVTKFQDQYYVERDAAGWLVNCSTDKTELHTDSELVGIHKIGPEFSALLMDSFAKVMEQKPKMGYEFALLDVARRLRGLYVLDVSSLAWYEIDDALDRDYAEQHIIPWIQSRQECAPDGHVHTDSAVDTSKI